MRSFAYQRRWGRGWNHRSTRAVGAGLIAAVLTAVGCGGVEDWSGDTGSTFSGSVPIEIVCSTGMVGDVVEHVGGDRVQVVTLMGEGVDPHQYKPSPGDIIALSRADMIVYSGLNLEGKMGEVFARLGRRKPSIALADWVRSDALLHTTGGQVDPHIWFDVRLWAETVDAAQHALVRFDPDYADSYARNADRYRKALVCLDAEVRDRIGTIPESRRLLVTAHDAFGYFGRAYGIEVEAIQGISTESEAGVREINELVNLLVDRRIPAVFVEASVSDRNVQALVEGCAARGHRVRIGGELYSDSMGPTGSSEGTYSGMIRHNVATITEALQ